MVKKALCRNGHKAIANSKSVTDSRQLIIRCLERNVVRLNSKLCSKFNGSRAPPYLDVDLYRNLIVVSHRLATMLRENKCVNQCRPDLFTH